MRYCLLIDQFEQNHASSVQLRRFVRALIQNASLPVPPATALWSPTTVLLLKCMTHRIFTPRTLCS